MALLFIIEETMEFHELANIFPMMSAEEYRALRDDIKTNGLRESIWIWQGKIIDGRNRYNACMEIGIEPEYRKWNGKEDTLASFIVSLNLHRRHLSESQRAMIAARLANILHGGDRSKASIDALISQADAANLLNVSEPSVERATKVQREGSPDLVIAVEQGKVAVSTAAAIAELPREEQKRIVASADKNVILSAAKEIKREKAKDRIRNREEQNAEALKTNPLLSGDKYKLIESDFRKSKIDDGSIDSIITDPPYSEEFLPLYKDLSRFAYRVLKNGGLCVVMTGQSYLGEVVSLLSGNLSYQWTLAYLTPGSSVQVFGRRIKSNWKPLVFLVKGKNTWEHIEDTVSSERRDKRFHHWGQSIEGMMNIVERFTVKNSIVLDPFCGAGTTGIASILLERSFVGIDNDEASIKKAAKRLGELKSE